MRDDLNKVVGEAYRTGRGSMTKPGRPARNVDDVPTRQGIGKPYLATWYGQKERRDHGAPVRRYLEKQVGRPWGVIYSELRSAYDARSFINQRVFEIVDRLVTQKNLFVVGGKVLEKSAWCPPSEVQGLYVHPITGLLCSRSLDGRRYKTDASMAWEEAKAAKTIILSATRKLMNLEGLWFLVEMAPVTMPKVGFVTKRHDRTGREHLVVHPDEDTVCHDVVEQLYYRSMDAADYRKPTLYAKSKKQLSHRELKQFGILKV